MRINQYLAKCNLGSRRAVEKLIAQKRIKVNEKIVTDFSIQIQPEIDRVTFDNKLLALPEDKIYLMLNKPANYIVSAKDEFGRKTVFNLLPDFGLHIFPIGRLDYHSEGLLLLTSDGFFAEKVMHPRYHLPKVYKVSVKGNVEKEKLEILRSGMVIGGKKTKPALVYVKKRKENSTTLRITIFEGKKRQIRLMLKEVGHDVLTLKRLQIGDVKLGKLPPGMWRLLRPSEILSFKKKFPREKIRQNEEL
jgi:23S rRNA pseudouridine2605 synthase